MAKRLNNQYLQSDAAKAPTAVPAAPVTPLVPIDLDNSELNMMRPFGSGLSYEPDQMAYTPSGLPIPQALPGMGPRIPEFKDMAPQSPPPKPTEALTTDQLYLEETSIGTKSNMAGGYRLEDDSGRLDQPGRNDDLLGGTITSDNGGTLFDPIALNMMGNRGADTGNLGNRHYEGVLGSFDYDPKEWAIGVKDIERDGGKTSVPVLRYIGEETDGDEIHIPEGVKNLDYAFEGQDLETVPKIPESVESAHASFMNCKHIVRACEDAKDGEHDVGDDTRAGAGIGTLAGAATGLAGAIAGAKMGAISGTMALPGVGSAIGAVGGALVGAAGGYFVGKDKDGRGGTWTMPSNLKDASYMFAGCENLTEGFEKGSDCLMNVQNMYEGTQDLGTDDYAIANGSVAITNFQETNVSKPAALNAFDKTNADIVAALGDSENPNYSTYWNESTHTLDKPGIDPAVKQEVEDMSVVLEDQAIKHGYIPTDMSVATGGLASKSTVHGAEGIRYSTDINEKNEVAPNPSGMDGLLGNAGSLIDRGIVSFGEYKILKAVTGNALIAGVATFGLQAVGILPKSMKPVLQTVAKFVGTESGLGKALNGLADKLPGAPSGSSLFEKTVSGDPRDATEKGKGDNTIAAMDSRVIDSMNRQLGAASRGSVNDISASMAQNGRAIVDDGILLTAANKVSNDPEFTQISQMSMTSAGAMEMKAIEMAGEKGKLDHASKNELSMQYLNIMRGFEAYDDAAKNAIDAKYGMGSAEAQQARLGLSRVMDAAVAPMLDSMRELDAQYGFIEQPLQQQLDKMNISGIGPYASYQTDYSRYGVQSYGMDSDMEAALAANAESLMAQSGTVHQDGAAASVVTGLDKPAAVPAPAPVSAGKPVSGSRRGAEAEARFGNITESGIESTVDFD